MNSTANMIETLTEGMEVVEMTASTPEAAARLGTQQAATYTARGYAYEFVGVIEHSAVVLTDADSGESVRNGLGYDQTVADKIAIKRNGYRAVIRPR